MRALGRWYAVVDGVSHGPYDAVGEARFRPDGSAVAWVAHRAGRALVVVDGAESRRYDDVDEGSLRWSPRRLAYAARAGSDAFVVIDGERGPRFDTVAAPAQDSESDRFGYIATRSNESVVIVAGEVRATETAAAGLQLAGGNHAYVARRRGRAVVVHGESAVAFDVVVPDTLVLSRDGRHWACLVGDDKTRRLHIAVDGAVTKPFDLEELVAAQMQRREHDARAEGERLRAWIRAELRRSLARHEPRTRPAEGAVPTLW
jgi:hypothetical protein